MSGHAFPPDAAIGSERSVGEDGVSRKRGHGVGIGFGGGAGSHAEKSGFRIDGAEGAIFVGANPGDVVANGPDFPAFEALWRNEHGEIGFSAGAGEGGGNVSFFALGIFHAEDEHVLGHPAFVARDVGSDAQRETFFAEQRVAAVAGAVGPDFTRFGKVDDVLFLVTGPGDVFLAGGKRGADGVHTGHDASAFVDFIENTLADAGHDAHIDDDVRRIGKLNADFGHGRADGAHAEGEHVHGAALHSTVEQPLEFAPHVVGIFPIVGGAGCVFGVGADESAILDAGDIVGHRNGRRSNRARAFH